MGTVWNTHTRVPKIGGTGSTTTRCAAKTDSTYYSLLLNFIPRTVAFYRVYTGVVRLLALNQRSEDG
jgi:hypothetical protein